MKKSILLLLLTALILISCSDDKSPKGILQFTADFETYTTLYSTDNPEDVIYRGTTDGFTVELEKGEYRIACGTGIAFAETFRIRAGRTVMVHYSGNVDFEVID
ncbi:MAG: hypothetical protein LUD76_04015 [Alistipes sp.]|nr:hypothetical protein [Alistipes sp.]